MNTRGNSPHSRLQRVQLLQLPTSSYPHRHFRFSVQPSNCVQAVEDVPTLHERAEDDVFAGELCKLRRVFRKHNEELGRVRVLARVRHRERAPDGLILQPYLLVIEFASVDRLFEGSPMEAASQFDNVTSESIRKSDSRCTVLSEAPTPDMVYTEEMY